ncbi:hypothetical protein LSCM1_01496 [Leishmania martiniquensis]|uniref:RING-CH-type domain-containing protein n=1 Tax=Leishmania martiniquensis TaxID=1580590 RepID=A0A836KHZ3_9TRYP|nr:hypothetical protein LSCM1_01496 [Leishmania martiniquensis]
MGIISGPTHMAPSSAKHHPEAAAPKPFEQAILSPVEGAIDAEMPPSALQLPQPQLTPAAQAGTLERRLISKLNVVRARLKAMVHESPITAIAQTSAVASLPFQGMGIQEDHLRAPGTASQKRKALISKVQRMMRAVAKATARPSSAEGGIGANIMNARSSSGVLMHPMKSYVQDSFIRVNKTAAHLPMTIIGSSTTVVQFNGKAGNIIKAVVQLRDHRYDKSVRSDNCYGMYLRVELRNRYRLNGGANDAKGAATVAATTQAHQYIGRSTWASAQPVSKSNDTDESSRPDFPSQDEGRGPWSSFWDSFAPIFDNSAMCKVLQSVSMRVSMAPITEPYYVVLHSTVVPSFNSMAHSTGVPRFPENGFDSPHYTCELDLFFEQESAARLAWLQLVFSLVVPLLVLFLPLPFTMWRADLVQQYMIDTDLAEWMWAPPLLLRKKMIDALKAGVEWVMRLRSAYQQRVLRNQLLRQEQAHRRTGAGLSAAVQQQGFGWGAVTSVAPSLQPRHLLSPPAADGEASQAEQSPQQQQLEPRRQCQFREAEASVSVCRSGSTHSRSSRESIASDVDEPRGSGVGAAALPRSPCLSDALIEDANICPSSAGESIGTRSHRRRARESRGAREAATAVSVHVPLSPDAARHWGEGHQRGWRARQNGHDVLFIAEEVAGAGRSLPAVEQHKDAVEAQQLSMRDTLQTVLKRPREEEEAMASTEDTVDRVWASGAPSSVHTGITAPSDAAPTAGEPAVVSAPTKAPPEEQEEEDEQFCRICREGSDVAPLIVPCACTGSVRFVHATCLDRWRIESAKRNLANVNHCEICKEPFRVSIQRSMLLWESWQHILGAACLFLTCFFMVIVATTLTHVIFGEMSCLASYHQVAYSTMFRFEGISLTLFIYCIVMLLVLFANLIVYSWFRSRLDVEEYVEEMHIVPPFYTRRNILLVVLVCIVLLAQVHATGYLLKYFLYKTSHIAWNWETSPLIGGVVFSLFSICAISFFSWVRHIYMTHIVPNSLGDAPATDVVVETINGAERIETVAANGSDGADPVALPRSITVPCTLVPSGSVAGASAPAASPLPPPLPSAVTGSVSSSLPAPPTMSDNAAQQPAESQDPDYTQHFRIPPDQRVIRAFEYCPPRRKPPGG